MTEFGAVHDGARAGDSPIMSSAPRVCRKCGAEIFADAPEGLCTACLFETGLDLFMDNLVAGVDDPGPLGEPLPERRKKSHRAKVFADFGDYELLEEIGRGGQGVVYRARQKSLNRKVALKVIGLGQWATEAHLKRFRREAEAAASLVHSGIVPIYEVGERDGSCYFSMKLVEGGQLDEVAKHEPMSIRRAVELIAKVARTVEYAHEHSILHRDLSTICLKCLEKDPKRRYPSALTLAEDLDRWLKHEPIRARRIGVFTRGRKWVRRNPSIAVMAAMLLALAAPLAVIIWKSEFPRQPATTGIAVLPFENLSEQREDATAFVDGVQDDILTKLARIADLKVISRTSVMEYRDKPNVRQIGNDLRVSYVLEGSIGRIGTRFHMNAQLIDTRTDTHVWVEQYDGDFNDLFAIQSEIAQKIAGQLHAKISAAEKLAIERKPTTDLVAFELYSRAISSTPTFRGGTAGSGQQAIDLLNRAVARDPSFFDAYIALAVHHDQLYFFNLDHTPARLAAAEAAVQEAFRIRPNAGEAHLARAYHLYNGYLDYEGALAELEVARQTLPNHPRLFRVTGFIQRRQGRWEESIRSFERALELDPRNVNTLDNIGDSYAALRRYADQNSKLDRILAIEPNDVPAKVGRALVELNWKADTRPLHQLIDEIQATNPAAMPKIVPWRLACALFERDVAAAKEALLAAGEESPLGSDAVHFPRPFVEGLIARMTNDEHKAQLAFTAARDEQDKIVQAEPDYGPALCVLGVIDAALGRKEEALREGRHAVELLPVEKDSVNGADMIASYAMTAAWGGEKNLAFEQLRFSARTPAGGTYADLKLMPWWDPLRGDPRFEKIVASLAPKERH